MPSRKRNHSPDSNAHISTNSSSIEESAKRLKPTSHAPSNPSRTGTRKQKASIVVSEQKYYTIKSIVKEKRGRYLIDWEDDPVTGEQFKPTWEPKGYANAEAVADWQRKRRTGRGSNKRKTATTNVSSTSAASKSSSPVTRRRRGREVVDPLPTQSTSPPQHSSPRQEALEVADSQPTQPAPRPSEYLAVQVSQHSSFDRDQYVQFVASGSTQDLSSSQIQHPDSGLGSSSPRERLAQRVIGHEGVVPDSQSLTEPGEHKTSIAAASTPPAQVVQTAYHSHRDSPLFSPDSIQGDNQEYRVTGLPVLQDKQIAYHNHQGSPLYSPCRTEFPPCREGSPLFSPCQAEYPPCREVSPLFSPCQAESPPCREVSPLFSPCLDEPFRAKDEDNQFAGGVQRSPNSHSARSFSEFRKDIPLASIESDNYYEASSSQIQPAPTQLPESFVSQVPGPPCSFSTNKDTMAERPQPATSAHPVPSPASSQSSGVRVPLRQRLKEMRARSAARSKAEKEARYAKLDPKVLALLTNGTGIVPEPFALAPQQHGNARPVEPPLTTSVVHDEAELGSQQSKHDLQNGMSQQFSSPSSFEHPLLGKMEFAIPLPLNSGVLEQYRQILYNNRHDVEGFVQPEVAEESRIVDDMRAMIERLVKLTIHSDLLDSMVMTQEQMSGFDQAQWAKSCSGKFDFLGAFITAARATDMHVVIIASHGKLLDILETFLEAHRAVYVRPDVMRRSGFAADGPLRFTLLATTDSSSIVSTAALVIAFDESVNTQDPRVTALRAHMLEVGKLSPLIHLLVVNSAEHIEKCLPSSWTGVQRLQALVSCVAQTRHKVGQLPPEMPGPRGAAEELAVLLSLGGREDYSTLPRMPKLVDVDLYDSSSQAGSSTQSATQQSIVPDIMPPSLNRKRSMDHGDDDDDISMAKRSRLTPVGDITHISDSITQPSQMAPGKIDDLKQALRTAEEQLESLKAAHASREAELQNTITITQQRLQEHVDALSDLQYRYETRSTDLHTLRSERDAAVAASALAHRQLDTQGVEIAHLKDQQRGLEIALKDAQTMLVSSTVPEVAALENARAQIVQLVAEKVQLEKRLASLTKDFEFTRQQYQLASTAAAENASALSDLHTEVSALRVQASGEAARLRQLNMFTENQVHLERAKQLEAILKERDEVLQKREEELRDLKRGRGLATRASSAPRSPRLGSRASSPMPGLLAGSAGRGGSALRFGS